MTRDELESLADLHETEDDVNIKLVLEIMSSMTVDDWEMYLSVWWYKFKQQIEYAVKNNIRFGFIYRLMMNDEWCLEFEFRNRFNSISTHDDNHVLFMTHLKSNHDKIMVASRSTSPHDELEETIKYALSRRFRTCLEQEQLQQLINYLKK